MEPDYQILKNRSVGVVTTQYTNQGAIKDRSVAVATTQSGGTQVYTGVVDTIQLRSTQEYI